MTRLALSRGGGVRVGVDQIGQPTSTLGMANQIVDPVIANCRSGFITQQTAVRHQSLSLLVRYTDYGEFWLSV